MLLTCNLQCRLLLLVEKVEKLTSQLIGKFLPAVLQQGVQSDDVALDAGVVKATVEVFGVLGLDVRSATKQKLADARVTLLYSEEKWGQASEGLIIDICTSIQKFLHDVLILRICIDCVHERSSLLLIFMVDQSLIIEQIFHELKVAFLTGHHQGRLTLICLLRVYIGSSFDK